MNIYITNLLNAVSLMGFSVWGFNATGSKTALIPFVLGVILMALNNGVKFEIKSQTKVAMIFTIIAIVGLFKPFMGAFNDNDTMGIFRVGAMLFTSIMALFFFIKKMIK